MNRSVSEESIRMRGRNPKPNYSDDVIMVVLQTTNRRIGEIVFDWITSPTCDYEEMVRSLRDKIKSTVKIIGERLPGGKTINSHDIDVILCKGVMEGLKLFDQAKKSNKIIG